ncbi:MAG: hypothetical protein ACK4ZR_07290 [Aquificaceae bacterium]
MQGVVERDLHIFIAQLSTYHKESPSAWEKPGQVRSRARFSPFIKKGYCLQV